MRTIEDRTAFLDSVKFSSEEHEEIENIEEWVEECPYRAAQYIVWLLANES